VQRLLDAGVMQIVAVTDPLQVGFPRQAMIGVKVEGDVEAVSDKLSAMAEVDYVVITAGSFDLMVEVVCEDDDHLLELLTRGSGRCPRCAARSPSSISSSSSSSTTGGRDDRHAARGARAGA
jgi:DNA-binding Lrp family transcriptional regulator